jgi:uncharacterized SAM-binding protein YcdF (DUF218 family)
VLLYVMLGNFFSDRVQALSEVLGDFTWTILGLIVVAVLGWLLWRNFRAQSPTATTKKADARKLCDDAS